IPFATRRRLMAEQVLQGSCLCRSVRYEVTTPFMRFGHCYCSRCRKATGGVRSTNIAVPIAQFRWTQGEALVKRFDLPEAKSFARQICGNCNCPVPHASRDRTRVIVPAGTLDDVPPGKPSAHGHWSSRVSWVEIDESELPCTDRSRRLPPPSLQSATRNPVDELAPRNSTRAFSGKPSQCRRA